MANIGYIRVSSQDQNLDRQLELMSEQNIDKLFQEKVSGKDTQRPEFQKLLKYMRECEPATNNEKLQGTK